MIETPPANVRAYLRSASIAAVVVLADGAVTTCRDLGRLRQPAVAAWWTTAANACAIVKAAREQENADVPAIAQGLRIALTPHARAVERARQAVARIDVALAAAKSSGLLQFFNRAYALERRKAAAAGRTFLAYSWALSRFKQAIYRRATSGGPIDRSLIAEALGAAVEETLREAPRRARARTG